MGELEFRKRWRTRCCLDLETYAKINTLLDCGDRAGVRRRLENCGLIHVADLLQLLDGSEEVSSYPHLPSFMASSHPAQAYRKQQKEYASATLSDFIPQRYLAAQTDLHRKRRAILKENVVLPKPLPLPALQLSKSTDRGEFPLVRVNRLPVYVSTMWLDCNVLSRETTDGVEQQQVKEEDDDEAKEETIFATIREFGPTSVVITALAEWFRISPELVLQICANSSLHALEHGNICNPHTEPKLDSFRKLFCPSCLVFDCLMHGPGAFPLKRLASEVRVAEDKFASHCARLFPRDRNKAKRLSQVFGLASSSSTGSAAEFLPQSFRPCTSEHNNNGKEEEEEEENQFSSDWHIPCNHFGECTAKNRCPCVKSKRKCLDCVRARVKRAGKTDSKAVVATRPLPPTATCTLSKTDSCTCVRMGRICDPNRCQCQCNCFVGQVALGKTQRVAVGLSSIHQGGWGAFASQPIAQYEFYCHLPRRVYDLDAFRKGSILKYANEAKGLEANSFISVLYSGDGRPNICMFAHKAIAQGEELTFDYGPKSKC
ncbi:hypothetical protein BASA81_004165 [Batrachochytrium salamandrivorans]|nr:hypothetical protein BASA81_004165 [Batrachochytrium salamandrivorans]